MTTISELMLLDYEPDRPLPDAQPWPLDVKTVPDGRVHGGNDPYYKSFAEAMQDFMQHHKCAVLFADAETDTDTDTEEDETPHEATALPENTQHDEEVSIKDLFEKNEEDETTINDLFTGSAEPASDDEEDDHDVIARLIKEIEQEDDDEPPYGRWAF